MAQKYQLLLLDGMNFLHRAAHSYGELSFREGDTVIQTGAIYGFLQMALTAWRRYSSVQCELVICWDAGYDHRVALYPEYKANRRQKTQSEDPEISAHFRSMPEQAKAVQKIMSTAGWRQAKARGYEADDVMATLAKRATGRVAICTGDQDLHQCVTENIHVISGNRGTETIWTPEEINQRWGIPPERVPEAKALAGDGGDNIPGCPGCGSGWATKILQTGSLTQIIKRTREDITLSGEYQGKSWRTPALTKKIRENENLILTCWELAKVVDNAPVNISQEEPQPEMLKRFFQRLRFNSLLEEDAQETISAIASSKGEAELPRDPNLLGFLDL